MKEYLKTKYKKDVPATIMNSFNVLHSNTPGQLGR